MATDFWIISTNKGLQGATESCVMIKPTKHYQQSLLSASALEPCHISSDQVIVENVSETFAHFALHLLLNGGGAGLFIIRFSKSRLH